MGPEIPTRSFLDNRTFRTERHFIGVWKTDNNRLTVTYWFPIKRPHDYSIQGAVQWIRQSQRTYRCAWDIEFAEGDEWTGGTLPEEGAAPGTQDAADQPVAGVDASADDASGTSAAAEGGAAGAATAAESEPASGGDGTETESPAAEVGSES